MTVPLDRTGVQDITSLDFYHARFRAVAPLMGYNITDDTLTLPYLYQWVSRSHKPIVHHNLVSSTF